MGFLLLFITVLLCFCVFPGTREKVMQQFMFLGSTESSYKPSALIRRIRSLSFSEQYSANSLSMPPLSITTVLSPTSLSWLWVRSRGKMGEQDMLKLRAASSPSEARLMALGLLSVELLSSVDRELFLAMLDLFLAFNARQSNPSWLRVLTMEQGLGGDLLRSGELKGEESLEEAVSLSQALCLCRERCLGGSLTEAKLIAIGLDIFPLPLKVLALDRGSIRPGRAPHVSPWKIDSFLLVWGLSSNVQKP